MATPGGYSLDTSKLSDKELSEYLNYYRNSLSRSADPNSARVDQTTLGILQDEINKRQGAVQAQGQKAELDSILNQGVQSSADQSASDAISRQALEDIFNVGKTSGTNTINEAYAGQRGQAIDEAAAAGLLRTPGFLTKSLAGIDAQKGNSLRDLLLGLEGQRASSKLGFEDTLFNRGQTQLNNQRTYNLSRAGLNQAGNQFQQTQGLQNRQFDEARNRSAMDDIFGQYSMSQAQKLGLAQANAAKPTGLQEFTQVSSGLGGLLGGIGSIAGAYKPKPPKPGEVK